MFYGYGILNNHVPTLKATAMKGGAALSPFLTSLYAVYKAESNANDSLGAYNGTAQGGLTYTAGKSGNAFTFNGTNSYVELPSNSINFSGSSFSVSFWVYLTNINSANYALVSNYANIGVNKGWIVGSLTTGKLYFGIYNPAIQETVTTATISINTWYHVTCVHTLSQPTKTYINGVLDSTSLTSYNPSLAVTHYPTIGASKFNAVSVQQYMPNGSKIDEVNIHNRILTATEITDLYNSGAGKFYPTF
jgi:hypothetical protein